MGRERALVVEDDPGLLGLYAEVLRDEGYDVDAVESGGTAVKRLSDCEYDVLLCDMVLPDSSGLEVIHAARREGQNLPIVLITGHATLKSAIAAVEKGVSRYLEKPITREDLLGSVEAALREHRQGLLEGEARARLAVARRGVDEAFRAALNMVQTACEPVHALPDGPVVAYCAVTPDRSCGVAYSAAMVRAAGHLGRMRELSLAIRRSAAAVRRTAAVGVPLLVPTPLTDIESERLLEDSDPLRPLAGEIVLDIWPPIPSVGGRRLVDKLEALRSAGYSLALPVPPLGDRVLAVKELGPVDYLRVDADLLSGIERDPLRQALVREAVARASDVEARVLASGWVSAHGREVLQALGCNLLQESRPDGFASGPATGTRKTGPSRILAWWYRLTGRAFA